MKTWTHSDLVARAARWLRNSYNCRVVLQEFQSCTGETPDAIGWKQSGRSVMVECKVSRSDFLADRDKPYRQQPYIALGAERYYMGPPAIILPNELPEGWGLLVVMGNSVKIAVACRPRKDLRSDVAKMYEMRMLIMALRRTELRLEPATLTDWLRFENREVSPEQLKTFVSKEDEEELRLRGDGWRPVVDPTELPVDPASEEPWCPSHEELFETCLCLAPNQPLTEYREINGRMYGRGFRDSVPLEAWYR